MAVYKRGDIWHFDFSHKEKRHRGSTGFKGRKDAERYVENLKRTLVLGIAPSGAAVSVGEVADRWFASRVAGKKTATTVAQRLKILFRHLDRNTPINHIGPKEIEAVVLARRLEPIRQGSHKAPRFPQAGTVNRDIIDTTLRPILSYAEEMEEPVRRIKWAKLRLQEPRGRVRVFSAEEIADWREALPAHHRPIFDFISRYGCRMSEAFFPPERVNVGAGEVYLSNTKNGRDHVIPLLDDDVPDLAARRARAIKAGLDVIWYNDQGGELTPIHWRAFQSASKAALAKAKIDDARPVHDLRHHAATTLARETGSLKLVQELLNHQSIVSSARYAHATKADLKNAMRHTHGTKRETEDEKVSRIKADRARGKGT